MKSGKLTAVLFIFFALISHIYASNGFSPVTQKPVLDGEVDDIYKFGVKFSSFKQIEPEILAPATVETEIYFIYDTENIYIAGRLYQPGETIKSSSGRKDSPIIEQGDYVTIAIDPLNNGNSAYYFIINPSNAVSDGILDYSGSWDTKWDGVFTSAAKTGKDYWSFELQIPLNSFSFQSTEEQTWGVMFLRNIAQYREKITNSLKDKNQPYRIDNFYKIGGLKGLKKNENISVVPFSFFSHSSDKVKPAVENKFKAGGEIRYNPKSSLTLIATFRPDYAQIETDKEIINVTDVPSSYPEKRPFFTESSDLYPGQAVNTRNIQDIDLGLKLRQVTDNLKYDLTWVLDGQKNKWYLGDARYTDNKTYHAEIITGLKQQKQRNDYNVTTNLRTWMFDKKLTAYTWLGTINMPNGAKNEWESVNSVKYDTRELKAGFWNHIQTKLYNPNIVGFNTLSNETILEYYINYSFISESGFFRTVTPGLKLDNSDLTSDPGNSYNVVTAGVDAILNLGSHLGNWKTSFVFRPSVNNKFRFRRFDDQKGKKIFVDAFSSFILVDQNRSGVQFSFSSDYSRSVGMTFSYDNFEVRSSKSDNLALELYWKFSTSTNILYSLENIRVYGSEYQSKFFQTLHRLKLEYNLSDRINFAGVFQLNSTEEYKTNRIDNLTPVFNVTASWEYQRGSFIYVVFNNRKTVERINDINYHATPEENESFAVKINKLLSF